MKQIFVFFLVLVLGIGIIAYAQPTQTAIVGTWEYTVVLDGELMHTPELQHRSDFVLRYTFDEAGHYTISADQAQTAVSAYETLLTQFMVSGYYRIFRGEQGIKGMDSTKADELWESGEKATAQEKAEAFLSELNLLDRYNALCRSGDYYVQGDTLYLSKAEGGYDAYTLTIDQALTISAEDTAYENAGIRFPLTLTPSA